MDYTPLDPGPGLLKTWTLDRIEAEIKRAAEQIRSALWAGDKHLAQVYCSKAAGLRQAKTIKQSPGFLTAPPIPRGVNVMDWLKQTQERGGQRSLQATERRHAKHE